VEFEIINSLETREVQNSWNNGREAAAQLPPSELNPLTNATLGQNLGRWAQVYFTTPPDQREHAVSRLLHELENEKGAIPSPPAAPVMESVTPEMIEELTDQSARAPHWSADIGCPACQHRNHGDQRFCGSCGSPLPAGQRHGANEPFAPNPVPGNLATARPESDMQWLRDKALASLDGSDAPRNHAWLYLLACVIVLLGGVGYLQWASQHHRPAAASASAVRPAAPDPGVNASQPRVQVDQPQPVRAQKPAEVGQLADKSPTVQTALASRENVDSKPVETRLGSAAQNPRVRATSAESALAPSAQANAEVDGGVQELVLAERYLEGKRGARDTTEAGKWLWKAVGKKNSTAAVLLADLYTRGDGVPKNCDQARILLVSATKKGAPQAAHALRNLETTGCR
jgi:hypothetical protein